MAVVDYPRGILLAAVILNLLGTLLADRTHVVFFRGRVLSS